MSICDLTWTKQLNEAQRQAVCHAKGPLLVLAGAGSGKTRVVISRIAYLIENGVEDHHIAAMTFTNKAANEMKERLAKMGHHRPWIGTFHSFGLKILRQHANSIGLNPRFAIYDPDDCMRLLKQVCGKDEKKEQIKNWLQCISHAKNHAISPEQWSYTCEQSKELDDPAAFVAVYEEYEKQKLRCEALDFDDLLFTTLNLFEKRPDVLQLLRQKYSYLLIDEYQDTNHCQYLIAKMLAHEHQNIFAVGDPDQSIYSWRGANIENILRFEKDFPGAQTIRLECNYRSTQRILHAANTVIDYNLQRLPKQLYSPHEGGDPVTLNICYDDRHEASRIMERIAQLRVQGYEYRDIALFYRTNFQSRAFEDIFIQNQVPYKIIGGLSFYQRKEIKDILALLRSVLYPNDLVSFSRMINIPKRAIGPSTITKIVQLSQKHAIHIEDLTNESIRTELGIKLSKKVVDGLRDFYSLIAKIREIMKNGDLAHLIEESIHLSGYRDHLYKTDENPSDREENLQELVAKGLHWQKQNPDQGLELFLEEISLSQSLDLAQDVDGIQLMTIHSSKGLEFPVVFLVGLEEQLFPHVYSKIQDPQIEEERRLFYVGMTRAMQKLFISSCRLRFLWGTWRRMSPSRFLFELPQEQITIINEEELKISELDSNIQIY